MRKRFLFVAIMLLAIVAVTSLMFWLTMPSSLPVVSERELADAVTKLRGPASQPSAPAPASLNPSRPVRLAIGCLGMPDDVQNRALADLVTAQLSNVKGLELVDRQDFDRVLSELHLSLSGLVRANEALRVGKLVRADWFLLGSMATIGRTNILVVRVVDARTGVLRDANVWTFSKQGPALASELARFVRETRALASGPSRRVYLAIGEFADVGINSRQAAFPSQLRAYLFGAYRNSKVTLLERDAVSALLQEVMLDLGGLTDEAGTNPPPPMQSGFWIADGFYQSFENDTSEVEVVLRINRLFGRTTSATLSGRPEEAFFLNLKEQIDSTIQSASSLTLAPTRTSEITEQMGMGKDLVKIAIGGDPVQDAFFGRDPFWYQPDFAKRRNLEEAQRAFETVLLLDHDNHEAKVRLSACLQYLSPGHREQAQDYLREVAGYGTNDHWSVVACSALGRMYEYSDRTQAIEWFEEASRRSGKSLYHSFAEDIRAELLATASNTTGAASPEVIQVAENRMMAAISGSLAGLQGKGGVIDDAYGLWKFMYLFGTNRQAGADRLVQLLPNLTNKFPDLAPHLLAAVVGYQTDTNAPVIAEFRTSLAAIRDHPQQIHFGDRYFFELLLNTYRWAFENKDYALASELAESKRKAATEDHTVTFDDKDRVCLALAYEKLERWRDALSVLEEIGDTPVTMGRNGPWGRAFTPFLPGPAADNCRAKLGLPAVQVAGRFKLDDMCLCLHEPSAFTIAEGALWVAIAGKLYQLDFDFNTNASIVVPVSQIVPLTALCVGPTKIWVGTQGAGLIEYDRADRKSRRLTESDGLLLNDVASLRLQNDTLWVGFGNTSVGGLGELDLVTDHLSAFSPALPVDAVTTAAVELPNAPPRHPVVALDGIGSDIWMMLAGGALRRYRPLENKWDALSGITAVSCFASTKDGLVAGLFVPRSKLTFQYRLISEDTNHTESLTRYVRSHEDEVRFRTEVATKGKIVGESSESGSTIPPVGALAFYSFDLNAWRIVADDGSLPAPPSALFVDGSKIWLAGETYIALFDTVSEKVVSLCRTAARSIDSLQVGGGYVWVKFDGHLHRATISSIR